MAGTAVLVAEGLSRFCPVTNLYACSDGRHVLVTVKSPIDVAGSVEDLLGLTIPISRSHAPKGTEVFLSDARGRVLDADGDPANGMTPLAKLDNGTSFEAALAAVGYELVTP